MPEAWVRASCGLLAAVGPDLDDQLVEVGPLADAGVLDGVLHAGDRREDRVDRDDADRHVGALVLVAGGEAAADADFHLGLELDLAVEGADQLLLVDDLVLGIFGDVGGGDFALLVDRDAERLGVLVLEVAELDLLQVEDDVGDVLDDARERAELVLGTFDFHRGDGGTFEGGEQHAAQGVSNRVAVAGLEWFGGELGVGVGGGGLVFDESVRHLETS